MTFDEWYEKEYKKPPSHADAEKARCMELGYKAGQESMQPLVTALLEVAIWYGGEGMEEEAVLEATKFLGDK